jgi:hypothetical protein
MTKHYTGIGSRDCPLEVQQQMYAIANRLAAAGYTLRSGGAQGADTAFETGCIEANGSKEIFLPWSKFEGNESTLCNSSKDAYRIAGEFVEFQGRKFSIYKRGTRALMARNIHQLLGKDLKTPSEFVVCWYSKTGGTSFTALVAECYKIPVYNLKNTEEYTRFHKERL